MPAAQPSQVLGGGSALAIVHAKADDRTVRTLRTPEKYCTYRSEVIPETAATLQSGLAWPTSDRDAVTEDDAVQQSRRR